MAAVTCRPLSSVNKMPEPGTLLFHRLGNWFSEVKVIGKGQTDFSVRIRRTGVHTRGFGLPFEKEVAGHEWDVHLSSLYREQEASSADQCECEPGPYQKHGEDFCSTCLKSVVA